MQNADPWLCCSDFKFVRVTVIRGTYGYGYGAPVSTLPCRSGSNWCVQGGFWRHRHDTFTSSPSPSAGLSSSEGIICDWFVTKYQTPDEQMFVNKHRILTNCAKLETVSNATQVQNRQHAIFSPRSINPRKGSRVTRNSRNSSAHEIPGDFWEFFSDLNFIFYQVW